MFRIQNKHVSNLIFEKGQNDVKSMINYFTRSTSKCNADSTAENKPR